MNIYYSIICIDNCINTNNNYIIIYNCHGKIVLNVKSKRYRKTFERSSESEAYVRFQARWEKVSAKEARKKRQGVGEGGGGGNGRRSTTSRTYVCTTVLR